MRKYIKKLKRFIYTKKVKRTIKEYVEPLYVNNKTFLTSNTKLGKNCHFNGMEITGKGLVSIGDNFHSGTDCLIITQFHNYDKGDSIPYDSTYITKNVMIEDNVWLGSRVLILGGVTIGEGAIIQAGAVVVSDIPKYGIAGGNPAKVFKYRDIEHYEECKSLEKFH
ncbi:acyltransferase [Gracilibacillus marinus]|uniref:Acyltransferase n=1 Tax=Gracilibacillus marinus TaxID=630535 RepID=A0ABV8VTD5_9BACI